MPPLYAVFTCRCCGTRVKRARKRTEYLSMAPFYVALYFVFGLGIPEVFLGLGLLSIFGLLSIGIWLTYFIRYEIAFD
jgi:hypothetical protein